MLPLSLHQILGRVGSILQYFRAVMDLFVDFDHGLSESIEFSSRLVSNVLVLGLSGFDHECSSHGEGHSGSMEAVVD